VEQASDFLATHDRFLVYSTNDPTWEWLVHKELADRASVQVLATEGAGILYLVQRTVASR
jgi:hypothetical protein